MISQQVSLLHEVSWILEAVGYKVQTSDDFDQDALWRRYSRHGFRDCRWPRHRRTDRRHVCTSIRIIRSTGFSSTIRRSRSIFPPGTGRGRTTRFALPLSRGELLARVRTGATVSRIRAPPAETVVTMRKCPACIRVAAFIRKLRKLAADDELSSSQHALLMTAIDWYAGIRRQDAAKRPADSLVNTAARAIKRAAGENAVSAYFGDGRFATLLDGPIARCGKERRRDSRQRFWQPRKPSRIDPAADAHQRRRAMVGG